MGEMLDAYTTLHEQGYAHSVETRQEGQLVGGLYGVALGRGFFRRVDVLPCTRRLKSGAGLSRAPTAGLVVSPHGLPAILTHVMRFGAEEIPRRKFLDHLSAALEMTELRGRGRFDRD